MIQNIILIIILLAVIGGVILYLFKEKKKGGCAGCPYAKECTSRKSSSDSNSGCSGSCKKD